MHIRKYHLVIFILLVISAGRISAQGKTVKRSNQQWVQYYGQFKLSQKWGINADAGFRWEDSFKKRLQYISRVGIGYQLNSRFRLATGFANLGSYGGSSLSKLEFRTYEEISAGYQYNKVGINHRFRVEERYYKSVVNGDILSGYNFNFRLRYQISANIPLINFENPEQKLFLNVADEIFVNAGSEIVYNLLDKNRFVIGPAFQFSKKLTIGLSYTHQFSQLNSPATYAHDDVMWLAIRHNVDFSKHQSEKQAE